MIFIMRHGVPRKEVHIVFSRPTLWFTALVTASLPMTGCAKDVGSTGASATSETSPANDPSDSLTSGVDGTQAGSSGLHGIVSAKCSTDRLTVTLNATDPETNQNDARVFTLSPGQTANMGCTAPVPIGRIRRQAFNKDFTRMAASAHTDDVTHVGYVTNDRPDSFVDLTPQTTGYADRPTQNSPVFHPVTGRLWFQGPDKLGSVDPDLGPSSSRTEDQAAFYNSVIGGYQNTFYFSQDGSTPLDLGAASSTIISPDGRTEVQFSGLDGFLIGDRGKVSPQTTTPVRFDGQICRPHWFVNQDTFICMDASGTQIYKTVIHADRTRVTQTAMLPETKQQLGDVVVDPGGTRIAFVSAISGHPALYVTSISGDTEPRKLLDLAQEETNLIDWIP
ncbi:hypothetical protein AB0425_32390 [Actinosynnema sp. NPDC051121]